MVADKFLEQVADYYCSAQRVGDMADITFVMPNKRSAMFLKRYIQQRVKAKAAFMPRFTTFARLIASLSNTAEAPRYDKLFTLYNVYRKVLADRGRSDQAKDFDKFVFWGDMILSDFDQIDSSLADPHMLYKNLKDLHEITADYLTDEQKEVVRNIWGETSMTQHVDTFWLHTNTSSADDDSSTIYQFIALWQILGPIYDEFVHAMEEKRMATSGMQMRRAVEAIKSTAIEKLARRRYVFAGHCELSVGECVIMDRLQAAGAADFYWDMSAEIYFGDDGNIAKDNKALNIIHKLTKRYPMPEDFHLAPTPAQGQIEIIGVPSNVAQAKMAGKIIRDLYAEGKLSPEQSINTAVVVPDASLLMPLTLALPRELKDVNVTMALPYSSTTFATLFRVIISMQQRARKRKDRMTFFFQDVLEVLVHPYLQLIAPKEAETIRLRIRDMRLYNIDATNLIHEFPALAYIFRPITNEGNLDEVVNYLTGLLEGIKSSLQACYKGADKNTFEIEIIDHFKDSIAELCEKIKSYGIEMHESTFMMMFERILSSTDLTLSGTPLQGMQIMGVLETRALDFDNIIIMSLNERTFPRHNYLRTMIPNNLRYGYGLPSIEQAESFYSYYFYHALSRASRATLIYDSRPANRGGGEMSRYLTQLIYLKDRGNISHHYVDVKGIQPHARTITIEKTPEVLAELAEFKRPGGPRISASSLKTFMQCPLRFYLEYVKQLRDDDDPSEFLSAAMLGTIFHNTVCQLYEPYKGTVITPAIIDELLKSDRLRSILMKEIAEVGYNREEPIPEDQLTMEAILIASVTEQQIRHMLSIEKEQYCAGDSFIYMDGEYDATKQWQITPDLKINFRMVIDRIDKLADDHLRFIDYKTGGDENSCGSDIANLFNGNHKKQGIFQLLLYAEAYNDIIRPNIRITPALHIIPKIATEGVLKPLMLNKQLLPDYPEISEQFRPLLEAMVTKIFDETPFTQCEDSDSCKYCKFLQMCGRSLPADKFVE